MCGLKKLFKKLYLIKVCSTEFFAICGSDLAKIELTVHAKTQKGLHFLISALDVVSSNGVLSSQFAATTHCSNSQTQDEEDLNRVNAFSQVKKALHYH